MIGILDVLRRDRLKKDPHQKQYDVQSEANEILEMLQRLWSTNGDALSLQYAGTNSNISGVLEEGKQGFAGKFGQMITGVQRYFVGNYTDPEKYQAIKTLMG